MLPSAWRGERGGWACAQVSLCGDLVDGGAVQRGVCTCVQGFTPSPHGCLLSTSSALGAETQQQHAGDTAPGGDTPLGSKRVHSGGQGKPS